MAGLVTGPIFLGSALLQGLLRPGFDLSRQPISFLSLGDLGWLQVTNFLVSGLLVVAFAVGVRQRFRGGRGAVVAPLGLVGLGLGLFIAGLFPPDPGFGYPPGTPLGEPIHLTYHSAVHGLGFTCSFLFFVVAAVGFASRDIRNRRVLSASYTALSAVLSFALAGTPGSSTVAIRDLIAALVLWTWLSVEAWRLLRDVGAKDTDRRSLLTQDLRNRKESPRA